MIVQKFMEITKFSLFILCLLGFALPVSARKPNPNPNAEITNTLNEIASYSTRDCTSDKFFYDTQWMNIEASRKLISSNYYIMKTWRGISYVQMYDYGLSLSQLNAADKLLDSLCYIEAKEIYEIVFKTTSEITFQNRAIYGLEKIEKLSGDREGSDYGKRE